MAALYNIDSTSGTKFSPKKKGGENEYGIFTRNLLSPHADVTYIFLGPIVTTRPTITGLGCPNYSVILYK